MAGAVGAGRRRHVRVVAVEHPLDDRLRPEVQLAREQRAGGTSWGGRRGRRGSGAGAPRLGQPLPELLELEAPAADGAVTGAGPGRPTRARWPRSRRSARPPRWRSGPLAPPGTAAARLGHSSTSLMAAQSRACPPLVCHPPPGAGRRKTFARRAKPCEACIPSIPIPPSGASPRRVPGPGLRARPGGGVRRGARPAPRGGAPASRSPARQTRSRPASTPPTRARPERRSRRRRPGAPRRARGAGEARGRRARVRLGRGRGVLAGGARDGRGRGVLRDGAVQATRELPSGARIVLRQPLAPGAGSLGTGLWPLGALVAALAALGGRRVGPRGAVGVAPAGDRRRGRGHRGSARRRCRRPGVGRCAGSRAPSGRSRAARRAPGRRRGPRRGAGRGPGADGPAGGRPHARGQPDPERGLERLVADAAPPDAAAIDEAVQAGLEAAARSRAGCPWATGEPSRWTPGGSRAAGW